MADITIVSPVRLVHGRFRLTLPAGDTIPEGSACYEDSAGVVQLAISDADGNGAQVDGVNVLAAVAGDPVTLFQIGSRIRIGAHGRGIGSFLYPSDTAGLFSDAPIIAAEPPIAKAVSATDIEIVRMDKPAVAFA